MTELELPKEREYQPDHASSETQAEYKNLEVDVPVLDPKGLSPLGREALAISLKRKRQEKAKVRVTPQTESDEQKQENRQAYHSYTPSKEDEYTPADDLEERVETYELQPASQKFSDKPIPYEDETQALEPQSYSLIEYIGRGGVGEVWKAKAPNGKIVAIKYFDKDFERYFDNELVGKDFDHPNVTRVLQAGIVEDGRKYLVREYVEGKSLRELLKEKGPLSEYEFLVIARQVIDGLKYLHGKKVRHRDLKPENILIPNDPEQPVKITDFGLVKAVKTAERELKSSLATTQIEGTPEYMAPEVGYGEQSEKSDVYSLGKMLVEMLTGKCPRWKGDFQLPPWAVTLCLDPKRSDCYLELQSVFNQCLEPNPKARSRLESLDDAINDFETKIAGDRIYEMIKPFVKESQYRRFKERLKFVIGSWIPGSILARKIMYARTTYRRMGLMETLVTDIMTIGVGLDAATSIVPAYFITNSPNISGEYLGLLLVLPLVLGFRTLLSLVLDEDHNDLLLEEKENKKKKAIEKYHASLKQ